MTSMLVEYRVSITTSDDRPTAQDRILKEVRRALGNSLGEAVTVEQMHQRGYMKAGVNDD